MARSDSQMKIRLPDELRDRVVDAAGKSNQSLNALIVSVLEQAFPPTIVDLRDVAVLLNALANEAEDENGLHGEGANFDQVNRGLSSLKDPWHVRYDDGRLIFYPSADPQKRQVDATKLGATKAD